MGFEFGDAFDFNEAAEVKRSSRNDNPAGFVFAKKLGVYSVDGSPVFVGRGIDAAENHLTALDTRGFKHSVEILERLRSMRLNVARADLARIRVHSGPDLPVCCSRWHSFRVSAQGLPAWWWERTSRRMFLRR